MTAMKKIFVLFLPAICAVSAACGQPADPAGGAAAEATAPLIKTASNDAPSSAAPDKVVVYYFHGTRRCPTCLGIQKDIEETIEEKFSKELEAGMLVFEERNFEEEENKHFVEQFQLSFSTMIVTARAGEKVVQWDNAGKIWDYAHAHGDLKAYVEENVRAYLKFLGDG